MEANDPPTAARLPGRQPIPWPCRGIFASIEYWQPFPIHPKQPLAPGLEASFQHGHRLQFRAPLPFCFGESHAEDLPEVALEVQGIRLAKKLSVGRHAVAADEESPEAACPPRATIAV